MLSRAVHRNRSLTEVCVGHGCENGGKDSGKLHKYKNQMAQCLYFALADDRMEAILFSLPVLFPTQKAVLGCLPSRNPKPYGVGSVCGYVLLVLL